MRVRVEEAEDRLAVLTTEGDLDMSTAGEFHGAVTAIIADLAQGPLDVLIDLAAVHFCDSSGFNALLRVQRRVHEEGGRFALASPPEPVARLLTLAGGGDALFTVYPTREAGADALRG